MKNIYILSCQYFIIKNIHEKGEQSLYTHTHTHIKKKKIHVNLFTMQEFLFAQVEVLLSPKLIRNFCCTDEKKKLDFDIFAFLPLFLSSVASFLVVYSFSFRRAKCRKSKERCLYKCYGSNCLII